MVEEFKKSISQILYERLTSPLAGTFFLAWLALNWRIPYVLVFNNTSMDVLGIIKFVETNYCSLRKLLINPALITLGILIVYPLISHASYAYWLFMKVLKNKTKNFIEKNELITFDQKRKLEFEHIKMQDAFDKALERKDVKIEELIREIDELKKNIQEHTNLVVKDAPQPYKEWERESSSFLHRKAAEYFPKVADFVQRGVYLSNERLPGLITSEYLATNLIEETNEKGIYKFTPKGKFFLEKYLELYRE